MYVQSITAAAALLAASDRPETLGEILAELGFPEAPLPLDTLACERLGLPYGVTEAQVARAEGTLRALILTVAADVPPRDVLAKVAARFAARVPHLLWLVIVLQPETSLVAIATWTTHTTPPRVMALVADRRRIVDSDAETLCALAASAALPGDVMRHTRWLEVLGREAVTQRFYRTLERVVTTLAESLGMGMGTSPDDARQLAVLYVSRLLFLSFLETKGWLNHDFGFLINGFADCMAHGGRYQQRVLTSLFFGTLNTRPTARAIRAHAFGKIPFLNGGLFSRTPLERRLRAAAFTDEALGILYGEFLSRYRFTAREDTTLWSEAAIDPEMLGKAFESLMVPQERKRSGSYYTPQTLVERITAAALAEALQTSVIDRDLAEQALAGTIPNAEARGILLDRTASLRVLDPACGSGAFLVRALEQIAALRARLGDIRPISAIRRSVLTTSIYGVDINPMAVWLCELRLWLSTVIDSEERDPMSMLPLPNLDHQIHVGDTLTGGSFDDARHPPSARTHNLFAERVAPNSAERGHLRTLRDAVRRSRTQRRRLLDGGALPFTFAAHCADVAEAGGFDVILGNPPWVRLQHIAPADRTTLRAAFTTFRDAAWEAGATQSNTGSGFSSQVDLAALFLERSVDLLAPNGTLGLLLPAKLWRSLAGGGTRRLLQAQTQLVALEDLSDSPTTFNAAVYPSILVARRTMTLASPTEPSPSSPLSSVATTAAPPPIVATVHRADTSVKWHAPASTLALDSSPGSPWLLIPPAVRTAFDYLARAGIFLAESALGRPYLGVKSGYNDAFIVRETDGDDQIAHVHADTHQGTIERALLRPLVRGESVRRWVIHPTDERIIWTHDADRAYARVIWNDVGKSPRAAVLEPGDPTVPLNSCYVVRCPTVQDAYAFAALLNAPLIAAWLGVIAEPARGGHRRHLGWTMALLPIPRDWSRARQALAPLAERGMRGDPPTGDELHGAMLYAYRIRADAVEPLMVWDVR